MKNFYRSRAFFLPLVLCLLFVNLHSIAQKVGINTPTPLSPLHVRGNDVILTLQEIAANSMGTGALLVFEGQTEANVPKSAYIGIIPSDDNYSHRNGSLEIRMPDRINFFRSVKDVSIFNMAMTIIGSTGNVGIGVSEPSEKLHVEGNIRLKDDGNIYGVDAMVGHDDLKLFGDVSGGPDLLISPSGNVGIGVPQPYEKLHLGGDIRLEDGTIYGLNALKGYNGLRLFGDNVNGPDLLISPSGNVGIGVLKPSEKLHVGGNIRLINDGNIYGVDAMVGHNDLKLFGDVAGGPDLFISPSGNVGINTTGLDNTLLTMKARNLDLYLLYLMDENNVLKFGVTKAGNVGINQIYSNYTFNVRAAETGQVVFNVENAAGNTSLFNVNEAGAVNVTGVLTKGGGSFKIDHPLDPENKYLYHSFVESPDMMNVYNGNITTNANGEAVIEMPEWFDALNKDFRYQLTTIGQPAQAYVLHKLTNNAFTIKTDKPIVEVSWQITGIRKDVWANKNRIPVEEMKMGQERGKYQHPESFGKPLTMGLQHGIEASISKGLKH